MYAWLLPRYTYYTKAYGLGIRVYCCWSHCPRPAGNLVLGDWVRTSRVIKAMQRFAERQTSGLKPRLQAHVFASYVYLFLLLRKHSSWLQSDTLSSYLPHRHSHTQSVQVSTCVEQKTNGNPIRNLIVCRCLRLSQALDTQPQRCRWCQCQVFTLPVLRWFGAGDLYTDIIYVAYIYKDHLYIQYRKQEPIPFTIDKWEQYCNIFIDVRIYPFHFTTQVSIVIIWYLW